MSSLANRQKQGEDKLPEREKKLVIGVDTGGTFTDLVFVDGQGRARRWKILSTPDDPSRAIIQGLRELLEDFRPEDIEIVHGTTVGTNAFLERKGARTCLITTKGFEDVIFIGRQNRPLLYELGIRLVHLSQRASQPMPHTHVVHEEIGVMVMVDPLRKVPI